MKDFDRDYNVAIIQNDNYLKKIYLSNKLEEKIK